MAKTKTFNWKCRRFPREPLERVENIRPQGMPRVVAFRRLLDGVCRDKAIALIKEGQRLEIDYAGEFARLSMHLQEEIREPVALASVSAGVSIGRAIAYMLWARSEDEKFMKRTLRENEQ